MGAPPHTCSLWMEAGEVEGALSIVKHAAPGVLAKRD